VAYGLARELVSLGHTVEVITMGFGELLAEEIVDGILVHRVDCGRRRQNACTAREAARYLRGARRLLRTLLARRTYDLVHAHFIFPDGILAWLEFKRRGIPFVITAHGSDVPGFNPKLFFRVVHKLLRPLWMRITQQAHQIIIPSDTLAGLFGRAAPKVSSRIIPNGIDVTLYRPAIKKQQILVATRLVERKGVQYLLRALAAEHPGWPVIVVGGGEYERELHRLNERLGRPAHFVGWMNNRTREFRQLLADSAIYVLPSDFENSSVALLEAMASGAAIVTTRGHGCEETVRDTAELVTPGRLDKGRCVAEICGALRRLTGDAQLRAQLGASARRRVVEHYAWDVIVRAHLEVYATHQTPQLLESPPRR
jgi:glycosyltransferase involved in cell wall biosynthesis